MTDDNAGYSHKVVVSCSSGLLFTGSADAGVSRIWIAINSAWMEQYPDTDAGIAYAVLETYNESGVLLGTSDPVVIEILCPDDMVPTAGTLTIVGTNMFGPLYIQGISSATATASGWSGVYGSTIKTVVIAGNGKTITRDMTTGATTYSDSLALDAGLLKTAGDIAFTLTVTDSRGRSASASESIAVTAYSPVAITSTAQGRLSSADTSAPDSGYVKVNYTYTPIAYAGDLGTAYNTPVLSIYWGADSQVVDGYASGSQERFADGLLEKTKMYTITLHLTDGITSTTVTRTIGTAYAFMRWDPKNNAVGFGCYPSTDHCVEIGDGWT